MVKAGVLYKANTPIEIKDMYHIQEINNDAIQVITPCPEMGEDVF